MTSRTHQGSGDPADGLNADDASGHSSPDEPDFDELRQILIGPEFAALDDLTSRIEQPARFSQDVARVLPEAIATGRLGAHYRLGWEEKRKKGEALIQDTITMPRRGLDDLPRGGRP